MFFFSFVGNDNIYALTNQRKYYLRIDLADFDNRTRYAFYDQFWIDNESQNYKLHLYDFSGDAGLLKKYIFFFIAITF